MFGCKKQSQSIGKQESLFPCVQWPFFLIHSLTLPLLPYSEALTPQREDSLLSHAIVAAVETYRLDGILYTPQIEALKLSDS